MAQSYDAATVAATLDATVERAGPWCWLLAVAFWGIGDWLTTAVSMRFGFGYETTPIVARTITTYGHVGHAGFKLVVFVGLAVLYRILPRPYRIAVPIGAAVAGAKLTANNVQVILAGM